MDKVLVVTFESHYHTILAKKKFKSYPFCISPTPRFISSSCSSCLVLQNDMQRDDIEQMKKSEGLEGIYTVCGKEKEIIYER